jgi:hypothetical protein
MSRLLRSSVLFAGALAFVTGRAHGEGAKVPAVTPAAAVAPVDDPVRAKELSDEAVALANAGDFRTACAKLEQSLALHHGLGTEFHLAGCWSKIGRTASAYALFEKVANTAHELGQTEREGVARQRMETLLPKLSRLRIDVLSPGTHMEVRRDDELVPESEWGTPVPVDRAAHELRATADGKAPWSTKLDVSDPATIVAVQIPALTDEPKEAPPTVAPGVTPPAPTPPKAAPPLPATSAPMSDGGTQRTLAIVLGSVGVAALAGGIVEGAQYLDSNREAKGICPTGLDCTEDEINRHGKAVAQARNERRWAYVGVGVGSAAVLGAAYLFFSAPHAPPADQRAALGVAPLIDGRGTWGGAVHGCF